MIVLLFLQCSRDVLYCYMNHYLVHSSIYLSILSPSYFLSPSPCFLLSSLLLHFSFSLPLLLTHSFTFPIYSPVCRPQRSGPIPVGFDTFIIANRKRSLDPAAKSRTQQRMVGGEGEDYVERFIEKRRKQGKKLFICIRLGEEREER